MHEGVRRVDKGDLARNADTTRAGDARPSLRVVYRSVFGTHITGCSQAARISARNNGEIATTMTAFGPTRWQRSLNLYETGVQPVR